MNLAPASVAKTEACERKIKCVVWDLDNTLWDGILLEDKRVTLRKNVVDVIRALDNRGIVNSISSRNETQYAMDQLKAFGIDHYFIYPQINWNSKAASIAAIAGSINIGIDTVAFVDDQTFEHEEVKFNAPEVLCIDAEEVDDILDMPEMTPRFITDESKNRRLMYQNDILRNRIEKTYEGPKESFLAELEMVFTIAPASEQDLKRAEELTARTHQLNTTGYTYNYDELDAFRTSNRHQLYVTSLTDKFGTYGKIGLTLIETTHYAWTIKLLLMSCRVISRGLGACLINHIRREAKARGVNLRAEFIPTEVNRMMYMTYKFAGFAEREKRDDVMLLENDLTNIPPNPTYVKMLVSTR